MIQARRVLVLVFPMLILACRSTVLPEREIPSDFVFGYEFNRLTDAPPSNEVGPPADESMEAPLEDGTEMPPEEAVEPSEEAAEEPATEGTEAPSEAGSKETEGEGAEPEKVEPLPVEEPVPVPAAPAPAPVAKLKLLKFEVRASGVVEFLVEYIDAGSTRKSGRSQVSDETLRKIYDRVREADLPGMDARYVGDDPTLGRETYHLIGMDLKEFWIDVEGTRVEELTRLWNDVMRMLPDREILLPPAPETKEFLIDRATGKIHRVNCSQAADVAPAARMPLPYPEAGLNVGGYPCEECRPLNK